MSFETIIWYVLGYSAIPMIFAIGIIGSLFIYLSLMRTFGYGDDDEE